MPIHSLHKAGLSQTILPVIQEIVEVVLLAKNVGSISTLLLDLALKHTGAQRGSLMLINPLDELYIQNASGLESGVIESCRVKIGDGIAGHVAKSSQALMVADIDADERFRPVPDRHYQSRSFISCPILKQGGAIGVLNLCDKKDRLPFSEDDFALAQIVAGQAAVALKNIFLFNDLRSKASEAEDANRKLIQADINKSEFLTIISHELRTPLNSIKGSVYHLQGLNDLKASDGQDFLNIIEQESGKLIDIVEKQLHYLRTEDETRIIKKSLISLDNLLKDILKSRFFLNLLNRKKIRLDIDLKAGENEIVGDKTLVTQLFINLLEGVVPFLETDGLISIQSHVNESFEIIIDGSGPLPEYIFANIFTADVSFFSEKSESSIKFELAKRSVDGHGWQMTGENRPEGFRIMIRIPQVSKHRFEAAINTTMELVLDFTSELFGVDTCSLMLTDDLTGDLVMNCARGMDMRVLGQTRIPVPSRIAGWVTQEGKPLLVENIENDTRFRKVNQSNKYNTKSLLSFPLKVNDQIIGVLNLNNKRSGDPFTQNDLNLGSVFIERVAHFVENLYSGNFTQKELDEIVRSLDELLSAERNYPKKDRRRLDLMRSLLMQFEIDDADRELAIYICMIYDLGLMLIDNGLLNKEKPLSSIEETALHAHPHTTLDLLRGLETSDQVHRIILHHHERFDGKGYPDQLKGEAIPLLSRALSIVDTFCAMTEERPYRKALSLEEALSAIRKESGGQFDPLMVQALEKIIVIL